MVSKSILDAYSTKLLADKVALVSGAGQGIGREIAANLCACGAKVLAVARTEEDLTSLAKQCQASNYSGEIHAVVADASTAEFLDSLDAPHIDILVNNLGTNRPAPFIDVTEEDFDAVTNLNLRAVFFVTQRIVRTMLEHNITGSIVNIGSQMGHVGSPNRSIYCATKHAIEGFTKALAVELAENNIRVNCVAPTFVKTPMTEPMLDDPTFNEFVMSNIPMRRLATLNEVANAVIYLASDLSASTTGTSLKVDGGWTAH